MIFTYVCNDIANSVLKHTERKKKRATLNSYEYLEQPSEGYPEILTSFTWVWDYVNFEMYSNNKINVKKTSKRINGCNLLSS